jgi:hypothetical protein
MRQIYEEQITYLLLIVYLFILISLKIQSILRFSALTAVGSRICKKSLKKKSKNVSLTEHILLVRNELEKIINALFVYIHI